MECVGDLEYRWVGHLQFLRELLLVGNGRLQRCKQDRKLSVYYLFSRTSQNRRNNIHLTVQCSQQVTAQNYNISSWLLYQKITLYCIKYDLFCHLIRFSTLELF